MTEMTPAEQLATLIKSRKTLKVLSPPDSPVSLSEPEIARCRPLVLESLEVAGWAPFHYARNVDGIAEPWRAYVLWHDECRKIAHAFFEWFDDVKPNNKLPSMLSACGALVLVTWLPQFKNRSLTDEDQLVEKSKRVSIDEEHLAASSAMVQNLLLLLTAHGMGTYWSSGGQLGSRTAFEKLSIPLTEELLAAVFVEFPETQSEQRDRLPGKHRESRCTNWIQQIGV